MNSHKLLATVGLLLFSLGATAQVCPSNDAFEPNESDATATAILVPYVSPPLAMIYPSGVNGDVDVFRFTLAPGLKAIVDVSNPDAEVRGSITGGLNAGDTTSFQLVTENFSADPLNVYVTFKEGLSTPDCTEYSFTISLQPGTDPCGSSTDDALEPNDDCTTSLPIGPGTIQGLFVSTIDPDYYRITVPPGQDAFVQIDYLPANGDIRLIGFPVPCGLLNVNPQVNNGTRRISFTNPGPVATEYDVFVALPPGGPSSCNTYDLTTTFLPSVCLTAEDPFEDNDTCAERAPLPLGETCRLLIDGFDREWFGIDVPPAATLSIELKNGLPSSGNFLEVNRNCEPFAVFITRDNGLGDLQVSATNNGPVTRLWVVEIGGWHAIDPSAGPNQCDVVDMTASLTLGGAGLIETMCGAGTALPGCGLCPCGNEPADPEPIRGCANSSGEGATLFATGAAFVSDDQLRFEVRSSTPSAFGILLSADDALPAQGACPPGSGFAPANFDGLRCVGGMLRRHGGRSADANGDTGLTNSAWGGMDGPPVGLIAQGGFSAGQTRSFQCIYRDQGTQVCMTGLNTTNAVRVTFAP